MTIGGYREGSGRPSEWKTPTERLRVPIHLHEQLKEIAHRLENGDFPVFGTELDKQIAEVLQTSRLGKSDRIFAGRLFDKLRQRLKNPPQSK